MHKLVAAFVGIFASIALVLTVAPHAVADAGHKPVTPDTRIRVTYADRTVHHKRLDMVQRLNDGRFYVRLNNNASWVMDACTRAYRDNCYMDAHRRNIPGKPYARIKGIWYRKGPWTLMAPDAPPAFVSSTGSPVSDDAHHGSDEHCRQHPWHSWCKDHDTDEHTDTTPVAP